MGECREKSARRPDCVTEIRMGNSVLVVSGFFKQDTRITAEDRMMRVLKAESEAGRRQEEPQSARCDKPLKKKYRFDG